MSGIGEACRALDVPITGGNVSLYNETDGRAIYPTPVIGVVGVLEHADRVLTRRFQGPGDAIVLFGQRSAASSAAASTLKVCYDQVRGLPPALDLAAERALQTLVVGLADDRLLRSASDCSDGGIAVALAESCFDTNGVGAEASHRCGRCGACRGRQRRGGALRRIGNPRHRFSDNRRCGDGARAGGGGWSARAGRSGRPVETFCGLRSADASWWTWRSTKPNACGRRRSSGTSEESLRNAERSAHRHSAGLKTCATKSRWMKSRAAEKAAKAQAAGVGPRAK